MAKLAKGATIGAIVLALGAGCASNPFGPKKAHHTWGSNFPQTPKLADLADTVNRVTAKDWERYRGLLAKYRTEFDPEVGYAAFDCSSLDENTADFAGFYRLVLDSETVPQFEGNFVAVFPSPARALQYLRTERGSEYAGAQLLRISTPE